VTQHAGISVVIPNYNGEQLLGEYLPSVLKAVERWDGDVEVIIVDDCSRDESCRVIRENFPSVRLLVNPRNLGFSATCNAGMREARFPILLCVNTDVRVEEDLLAVLAGCFTDPDLFAVTPRVIVEREGKNQGVSFGRFSRGFLKGAFAAASEPVPDRENLYAVGACVAYDAEKFRALGGYSEIYTPYLFEDVDISYRAWKRGWKSVYTADATVWHYSNATLAKAKRRLNKTIYFRNRFIFHWVNLSDPAFVARNALNTTFRLLVSWIWLNFVYYQAFFAALSKRKEIAALRRAERAHRVLGDAEVLNRVRRT
jgi:GT2 family glycosyltransferase